jgi:Ca-activated chloride channel family protein
MKPMSLFSAGAFLLAALSPAIRAAGSPPAPSTAPVHLRIDVDRSVLPAGRTGKAIVKIALDCPAPRPGHRAPVNLALVIDRSGSMGGEKIAKAREAALEAVRRLAPDDIASLVAYDTGVETLVPAQRVGDGRRLAEAICRIEARGNTALHGGVSRAADELRRHIEDDCYSSRIVLLSDGLANVGPSSARELGRLGTALVKEGISVTTIGLGLGFNEDLMTRLAECSDGNTYFVENSADLPRIFAAELGDALGVVARRVAIEIEFPDGVRPIGFVGREGAIHGQRAELALNQLYGGQEKFALVEVEVSAAPAGAEREIARARIRYDDALERRALSAEARRTVQFSGRESDVLQSADARVQVDYAANLTALAKDTAVSLVDASRPDEAARQLRERNRELDEIARTYRNTAVQALVESNAREAEKLEREGLDGAARKSYRAESAQVRNQQASSFPERSTR